MTAMEHRALRPKLAELGPNTTVAVRPSPVIPAAKKQPFELLQLSIVGDKL